MQVSAAISLLSFSLFAILAVAAPEDGLNRQEAIPLLVRAGEPLRVYLTKRVPKRVGAEVQAKVMEPVWAFDREVIPAGAVVIGRVSRVQPVSKMQRASAMMSGDFTPLRKAYIEFTTVVMPDGHKMALRTEETLGLNTIMSRRPAKQPTPQAQPNTGVLAAGKQQARDMIQSQIERVKSVPDMVRAPDKKERVEDYLISRLPYHPQYVRKGTRFDAELLDSLSFGSEPVTSASLERLGTQPPADAIAHAQLITELNSGTSKPGETVEAVLAAPVFSVDHKLLLPEGTRLEGTVVAAKKARRFRRSGQLRFTFKEMELPADVVRVQRTLDASIPNRGRQESLKVRTQANLKAAESGGKGPIKVDSEGGVQAKEPKTRFLAAAASIWLARVAGDNDPIRNSSHQVIGQSDNVGGRTLGGGFGFGLLGMAISQSSRYVGSAFGYYGMMCSLYSTLIARGAEVQFRKNAAVDVRFNARPERRAAKPK